jgi:2-C-methyl-D-erythritol 2,4-cyclodiphosphate synthase
MRIGIGHDTHRLVAGRPLILCGVRIDHAKGLAGHSDADVGLHALTDAILGAASLGDIGDAFPDGDPQWQNADSTLFLNSALARMRDKGYRLVNVDLILFAEEPKLGPLKEKLRRRLAELLHLPIEDVNVKAKTGEGIGAIGRGEALAAQAVVLLDDGNGR